MEPWIIHYVANSYIFCRCGQPFSHLAPSWHRYHVRPAICTNSHHFATIAAISAIWYRISNWISWQHRNHDCSTGKRKIFHEIRMNCRHQSHATHLPASRSPRLWRWTAAPWCPYNRPHSRWVCHWPSALRLPNRDRTHSRWRGPNSLWALWALWVFSLCWMAKLSYQLMVSQTAYISIRLAINATI